MPLSVAFRTSTTSAQGRASRPGPEADLVDRFVQKLPQRTPRNCRLTLFREPRLLTGFPDLVAVTWHVPTAKRWTGPRLTLTAGDLRLVQLLISCGDTTTDVLRDLVRRAPNGSLQRLVAAGLVSERRGRWRVRRLTETFAVRGIVAFEAKISAWRRAVVQASQNRWFATESYVLLPKFPSSNAIVAEAVRHGIGVWVDGQNEPVMAAPAQQAEQPLSFASWLLNEWAWRDAVRGGHVAPEWAKCLT